MTQSVRDAADAVSAELGLPRRQVYQLALKLEKDDMTQHSAVPCSHRAASVVSAPIFWPVRRSLGGAPS